MSNFTRKIKREKLKEINRYYSRKYLKKFYE